MSRQGNDLILDNKYNQGDTKFELLPEIKVDESYRDVIGEREDSFENYTALQLEEFILDKLKYFENEGLFINKKNYEENIIIFYKIYEEMDTDFYEEIEFFTTFCEICQLDYRQMFDNLLPKLKAKLLNLLYEKVNFQPKFVNIF